LKKDASTSQSIPNSRVALFDIATPGSLPRFQKSTLIPALRAAIALGCSIQRSSRFDRKHYFYHDQPAGYQLTQYYQPFALSGNVKLTKHDGIGSDDGDEVTIGIKQIQMEQDTAKSHESDDLDNQTRLIDFNRAGRPLIEIISLPQIHSPETAAAYVRKVQAILMSVDAVTTGMEMGGLRADVNVSVRLRDGPLGTSQYSGITGLGQRTEIKNISTLKGVVQAIKAERNRQINVLEAGGHIEGETRGWSLSKPTYTFPLRSKEGEVDYRYMPDPDIAPIIIGIDVIQHIRNTLPKLPQELSNMLTEDPRYGLSAQDAGIMVQLDDGERLDYYLSVVDKLEAICKHLGIEEKTGSVGPIVANWVMHELGALLTMTEKKWSEDLVTSEKLALILGELLSKRITATSAKQVFKMAFDGDPREVDVIIRDEGLVQIPLSDDEYVRLANNVIQRHAIIIRDIRVRGHISKLMFLVGQVIRSGGRERVEPKKVEQVLRRLILNE
jgi:aspartyl-tRNA(Asn)/glutamyl-tRNA(Gln) amidotransferase subunit B